MAMKQAAALVIIGALQGSDAFREQASQATRADAAALFTVLGGTGAAAGMTPEDLANCLTAAAEVGFESHDKYGKAQFIEKWGDHCAVDKRIEDANYVCPHFKEGLGNAFKDLHSSDPYTTQEFCKASEQYMLAVRGASRVPNMGSGPLTHFKLSPKCMTVVEASLSPATSVKASEAANFWYALCMDQDCGNYLPSRTRWCEVSGKPTHTAQVCEAAHHFIEDGAEAIGADLSAEDLCHLYSDFVQETGLNVEAYEHVMHDDDEKHVPVPGDHQRAMDSVRMQNSAGKNFFRDNAGKPVKPHSGARMMTVSAALATVLAGIALQ